MISGFIFILFELRNLTKLISDGKSILKRFEQDLIRFEGEEKNPSDELIAYVKNAIYQGVDKTRIQCLLGQKNRLIIFLII
jgi:hypothetical protein